MAITIGTEYNQLAYNVSNNQAMNVLFTTLTFGNPYTTGGGDAFDPTSDLTTDFTTIYGVFLSARGGLTHSGYVPAWDSVNKKVLLYNQGTLNAALNEAGADNTSTLVVDCMVIGV